MKAESRGLLTFPKPAAFRRGIVVSAVAALALAAPAHAQTTTIGGGPDDSVTVNMGVLNQMGSPPNVAGLMIPSVRSLLMPNAPADHSDPRLQQLVPPSSVGSSGDSGRLRLTPPGRSTASRAAPRRQTARRTSPAKRAPADKPQQLTRSAPEAPKAPEISLPSAPAPVAPEMPAAPKMSGSATANAAPTAETPTAPSMPSAAPPPPPPPPAIPSPPAATTASPAAPAPSTGETSAPAEKQTASTAPAGPTEGFAPGKQFRLMFSTGDATLETAAQHTLDEVATSLKKDESLRLQLFAYAGSGSQTDSQARRLSLSRALKVRSYLLDKGVRSTRIDVRALGKKTQGGPPDRVDLIVTAR